MCIHSVPTHRAQDRSAHIYRTLACAIHQNLLQLKHTTVFTISSTCALLFYRSRSVHFGALCVHTTCYDCSTAATAAVTTVLLLLLITLLTTATLYESLQTRTL
jgi:hypothetical protein